MELEETLGLWRDAVMQPAYAMWSILARLQENILRTNDRQVGYGILLGRTETEKLEHVVRASEVFQSWFVSLAQFELTRREALDADDLPPYPTASAWYAKMTEAPDAVP